MVNTQVDKYILYQERYNAKNKFKNKRTRE